MNIRVAGITEEELKIKMERNEEAAAPTPSVLQAVPSTPVMDLPSEAAGKKPHEVNLDNPAPPTEVPAVASTLLDDSDKNDQKSDKGDEDKPEVDRDDEADKESEELSSLAGPIHRCL